MTPKEIRRVLAEYNLRCRLCPPEYPAKKCKECKGLGVSIASATKENWPYWTKDPSIAFMPDFRASMDAALQLWLDICDEYSFDIAPGCNGDKRGWVLSLNHGAHWGPPAWHHNLGDALLTVLLKV